LPAKEPARGIGDALDLVAILTMLTGSAGSSGGRLVTCSQQNLSMIGYFRVSHKLWSEIATDIVAIVKPHPKGTFVRTQHHVIWALMQPFIAACHPLQSTVLHIPPATPTIWR